MLEKFQLKRCTSVTILKLISLLLSLAMIVAIASVYYPVSEKYETVEDVKASRAFDALVDSAGKIFMQELNQSGVDHWAKTSFVLEDITWIYSATNSGYILYSKFNYTFNGQSKVSYCKTSHGDVMTRNGMEKQMETKIISEEDYNAQKSNIIRSEYQYDTLAVNTVFAALADKWAAQNTPRNALAHIFGFYRSLQYGTIHSVQYTWYSRSYSSYSRADEYLFEISYTDAADKLCTEYYYYCSTGSSPIFTDMAKDIYELSLTQYLEGEKANYTTQGTCHNFVIVSAMNRAKEGA